MRIIGIDPGLLVTGFACVERSDEARADGVPALVEAGVFRLGKGGGEGSVASRLAELDSEFRGLLESLRPGA